VGDQRSNGTSCFTWFDGKEVDFDYDNIPNRCIQPNSHRPVVCQSKKLKRVASTSVFNQQLPAQSNHTLSGRSARFNDGSYCYNIQMTKVHWVHTLVGDYFRRDHSRFGHRLSKAGATKADFD